MGDDIKVGQERCRLI